MRTRRLKVTGRAAIYHLISRTAAGEKLLDKVDQEVLRKQIRQMAAFCGIEVLTYCILSNHFHLLVKAPAERDVTDEVLVRRYRVLYGHDKATALKENLQSALDPEEIRTGLLKRMHDISFFMKELKMRFTIYYNKNHNRFGTLWAERFKSLLVESKSGQNAVLAVAAYIDLNPVRAGLCEDPKDYRFCGYAEAVAGGIKARGGLTWIIGQKNWGDVAREYRTVLFGAGVVSDRSREGGIDWETSREVMEAGGKLDYRDLLRCRVRYFSDGLALGSAEFIAKARAELFGRPSPPPRKAKVPVGKEDLYFARARRGTER